MKSKKKSSKAPWGTNRQKDARSHPDGATARPMLAQQGTTVPQTIDAPRSLVAAGILLVAGAVWAYWPNLVEMVGIWESQPDYSHGYLVLPLALGLLWLRRDAYPVEGARPALVAGLLVVGLSVAIRLLAAKFFYGPIDTWSLLIWVAGTVLALWGWRVLWWALPSIFFLWFAMPLPFRVETMLRQPLQRLATELSSMVLVAFGQPAIAEANVIRIGDHVFGVDEACSGLRIFLGIAAFAFVLALLWRTSWIKRILLLLSDPAGSHHRQRDADRDHMLVARVRGQRGGEEVFARCCGLRDDSLRRRPAVPVPVVAEQDPAGSGRGRPHHDLS